MDLLLWLIIGVVFFVWVFRARRPPATQTELQQSAEDLQEAVDDVRETIRTSPITVTAEIVEGGKSTQISASGRKPNEEERIFNDNKSWLEERWTVAQKEREAGELKTVPHWFFDEATDRQLQKIEEMGLGTKDARPTKGEASDIIGLFSPAEEENEEILKFFKVPLRGINQSRSRHEVAKLLSDPKSLEAWKARPASQMQKEFYRYFNLKVSQRLTYEEASRSISDHEAKLSKEGGQGLDEWEAYTNIFDEINAPDFREDYEIKKVSISLYRSAIEQLKRDGRSLTELDDDIDLVVKKILEIKPETQKA